MRSTVHGTAWSEARQHARLGAVRGAALCMAQHGAWHGVVGAVRGAAACMAWRGERCGVVHSTAWYMARCGAWHDEMTHCACAACKCADRQEQT
eukprot:362602-Chlamydomonas_euryale.AAC.1